MLGKALTTAVLLVAILAAPQARADAALSATIVIARAPPTQAVHQGGHQRHWHKPARQHWGGHQPRQHAHRHGKAGGH